MQPNLSVLEDITFTGAPGSCAWVIIACTAWGINPDTDSRFIKNGNSVVDGLLAHYVEEEAMFQHIIGAGTNAMGTDQGCCGGEIPTEPEIPEATVLPNRKKQPLTSNPSRYHSGGNSLPVWCIWVISTTM